MNYMNSGVKNRNTGRFARVAIWVARMMAAALILVSSFALAWATSRSNASRLDIDVKSPQPAPLHTKPPSANKRHRAPAGHHAAKPITKSHAHGKQSANHATSQTRGSAGGKHGSHSQADITPTPTPEDTPTATPGLTPGLSPMASPVSFNID